jgi:hypothetical protein
MILPQPDIRPTSGFTSGEHLKKPLLFSFAVSGERPIVYSATSLPPGAQDNKLAPATLMWT